MVDSTNALLARFQMEVNPLLEILPCKRCESFCRSLPRAEHAGFWRHHNRWGEKCGIYSMEDAESMIAAYLDEHPAHCDLSVN